MNPLTYKLADVISASLSNAHKRKHAHKFHLPEAQAALACVMGSDEMQIIRKCLEEIAPKPSHIAITDETDSLKLAVAEHQTKKALRILSEMSDV